MVEATQMFSAREIVGIFSLKLAWICICLDSVTDDNQSPIGNKDTTAFAEMLFTNKSLKELNLAGNSTQDNSICEESIQKLIDSLTHNTTVRLGLPMKYESLIADSRVLGRVTLNYATTTSPPL